MENDPERKAAAPAHAADAMAHRDAVIAARPANRSVIDRENHRVAETERYDLSARLHPRPCFDQHEFASRELIAGSAEQYRRLYRKDVIAIEILVQAVVVACLVF